VTSAVIDVGPDFTRFYMSGNIYEGLRGIAADGSDVGASFDVGDRLTLLGFFSVNLKTALDGIPATANAPGFAHSVEDALEFFIFGKTTKAAWPKSTKCE
jgi:hypothetical protein